MLSYKNTLTGLLFVLSTSTVSGNSLYSGYSSPSHECPSSCASEALVPVSHINGECPEGASLLPDCTTAKNPPHQCSCHRPIATETPTLNAQGRTNIYVQGR